MPSSDGLAGYARGTAVAFEFTGTILGAAVVGWWIDEKVGSGGPVALAITLIGIVSGFVRLLQMLKQFQKVDRERDR